MHLTDHKTVGLQYAVTAAAFLLLGFLLMLVMRWQPGVADVAAAAGAVNGGRTEQRPRRLRCGSAIGITTVSLISAANPLGIDRTTAYGRDDVGLLNVLTVPVGRPVVVHLSSRDVVHSFTLNEMRVRQDATPGVLVRTWFTPTITGNWEIACSQLCGLGHYRMKGEFSVVAQTDWDEWQAREVALLGPPATQP